MSQMPTHSLEELAALGAMSKRRNDLAVFAGRGGRLMDNVKYCYLHAATHDVGFEPWFFTMREDEYALLRDNGLPVITLDSRGVKILTSAGFLVMDDQPLHLLEAWCLGAGAKKMQLWHGIPLKKIGFPEIESQVNMNPEKAASLRFGYSGYDVTASTSPWVTRELFSRVFESRDFMELGYPRNDILLRDMGKCDLLNVDTAIYSTILRHKKSGGRVVIYMPTFRDTGLDFVDENGNFVLDPPALARYAQEQNTLFVLKLHPYVDDARLSAVPGILRYPSHQDIYPLLPLADALITDYSSVYFDYLLLNRPVLFFAYDEHRYMSKDRELFFPYESMTPGPVARDQASLLTHLSRMMGSGQDAYADARLALRDQLFAHHDAGASARICEEIRFMLQGGAMLPRLGGTMQEKKEVTPCML